MFLPPDIDEGEDPSFLRQGPMSAVSPPLLSAKRAHGHTPKKYIQREGKKRKRSHSQDIANPLLERLPPVVPPILAQPGIQPFCDDLIILRRIPREEADFGCRARVLRREGEVDGRSLDPRLSERGRPIMHPTRGLMQGLLGTALINPAHQTHQIPELLLVLFQTLDPPAERVKVPDALERLAGGTAHVDLEPGLLRDQEVRREVAHPVFQPLGLRREVLVDHAQRAKDIRERVDARQLSDAATHRIPAGDALRGGSEARWEIDFGHHGQRVGGGEVAVDIAPQCKGHLVPGGHDQSVLLVRRGVRVDEPAAQGVVPCVRESGGFGSEGGDHFLGARDAEGGGGVNWAERTEVHAEANGWVARRAFELETVFEAIAVFAHAALDGGRVGGSAQLGTDVVAVEGEELALGFFGVVRFVEHVGEVVAGGVPPVFAIGGRHCWRRGFVCFEGSLRHYGAGSGPYLWSCDSSIRGKTDVVEGFLFSEQNWAVRRLHLDAPHFV